MKSVAFHEMKDYLQGIVTSALVIDWISDSLIGMACIGDDQC